MPFRRPDNPRRGRPPAAGPRPPRPEPEAEAEAPEAQSFRSSFRRDFTSAAPSPFRREEASYGGFEVSPRERSTAGRPLELWEVLVPESERRDPGFDYSHVFDVLAPVRGQERGRPSSPFAPGPSRGAPPPPPPQGAPESRRAGRAQGGPPTVDLRNWFDAPLIFEATKRAKADPRFKPGQPVALIPIAPASASEQARMEDLIKFFRIPPQEVDRYPRERLWSDLLHPFLDELSYAFNTAKPADLPGSYAFQVARDGSFWLGYME